MAPPTASDGLGEAFLRVSRAVRRSWVRALEPTGLSPHLARALHAVVADGPLRLGALAERLHIAPRSATDVADALADLGLVERRPDPGDRRAVVLAATDRGRSVDARVAALRAEGADTYFACLSAPERAELRRLLDRLDPTGADGPTVP